MMTVIRWTLQIARKKKKLCRFQNHQKSEGRWTSIVVFLLKEALQNVFKINTAKQQCNRGEVYYCRKWLLCCLTIDLSGCNRRNDIAALTHTHTTQPQRARFQILFGTSVACHHLALLLPLTSRQLLRRKEITVGSAARQGVCQIFNPYSNVAAGRYSVLVDKYLVEYSANLQLVFLS